MVGQKICARYLCEISVVRCRWRSTQLAVLDGHHLDQGNPCRRRADQMKDLEGESHDPGEAGEIVMVILEHTQTTAVD